LTKLLPNLFIPFSTPLPILLLAAKPVILQALKLHRWQVPGVRPSENDGSKMLAARRVPAPTPPAQPPKGWTGNGQTWHREKSASAIQ